EDLLSDAGPPGEQQPVGQTALVEILGQVEPVGGAEAVALERLPETRAREATALEPHSVGADHDVPAPAQLHPVRQFRVAPEPGDLALTVGVRAHAAVLVDRQDAGERPGPAARDE